MQDQMEFNSLPECFTMNEVIDMNDPQLDLNSILSIEGAPANMQAMSDSGLPSKKTPKSSANKSKIITDTTGISEEELYQRRKAQNRAAQRAFRERKEGKLKELSEQLAKAEEERLKLEKELDEIKQRNALLDMENQYLQQQQQRSKESISNTSITSPFTSSSISLDNDGNNNHHHQQTAIVQHNQFKFPSATKADFILATLGASNIAKHHLEPSDITKDSDKAGTSYEHEDERVLTISAVWDYIMEFCTLNEDLDVDVPAIMDQLRGQEVCHGFGPAYPLEMLNKIILASVEDNS